MLRTNIESVKNNPYYSESIIEFILQKIGEYPLLSYEETAQAFVELAQAKVAVESLSHTTTNDRDQLLDKIARGAAARELLVLSNLRFVVKVAKEYKWSGEPLEDLIQQGIFGLFTAIDKFDEKKNFHFLTYANNWIRQSISRYIKQNTVIRIPVYLQERIDKHRKIEEMSQEIQLSKEQTKTHILGVVALGIVELDKPRENETAWDEIIEDENNSFSAFISTVNREFLQEIFEQILTPREELVVKLLCGFIKSGPYSEGEIADKLGRSKDNVNKTKISAFQKLRKHLLKANINGPASLTF